MMKSFAIGFAERLAVVRVESARLAVVLVVVRMEVEERLRGGRGVVLLLLVVMVGWGGMMLAVLVLGEIVEGGWLVVGFRDERRGERGLIAGRRGALLLGGRRGLRGGAAVGGAGKRGMRVSLVVWRGGGRLVRGWCFSWGRKSSEGRAVTAGVGGGFCCCGCFGGGLFAVVETLRVRLPLLMRWATSSSSVFGAVVMAGGGDFLREVLRIGLRGLGGGTEVGVGLDGWMVSTRV